MPWQPLLTDEEVQRAEGYYGTGRRIRKVAAKLLAGQPIQVRGGWGAGLAAGGRAEAMRLRRSCSAAATASAQRARF